MTQSKNNCALTPVGRMVQGSCFKAYTTDLEGNPLVIRNGVRAGQPREQYFLALAIDKKDKDVGELLKKIANMALLAFPMLHDKKGNCTKKDFAWKVVDGDEHLEKEGFAGCWVFRLSGGFSPKCRNKDLTLINPDENYIKLGDYIRAYISINGNGSNVRPGMFLNPIGIQFIAYGKEIIVGNDGKEIFNANPVVSIPLEASETPRAGDEELTEKVQPHHRFIKVNKSRVEDEELEELSEKVQPHHGFINANKS